MKLATPAPEERPSGTWWRTALVVALVLVPVAWAVQRLVDATEPAVVETVASARDVASAAGQAAREVGKVASIAREALQPASATRDPVLVEAWLQEAFRITPPPGHVGAFGLKVQLLGQPVMQVTAAIPKGAKTEEIFQGEKNPVRFSPGPHTIFVAARFHQSSPAQSQEAFAEMEQADRRQPYERVFIAAGGKRVAALRGAYERYGQWNTAVIVFLDNGRIFYAAGPKGAFDDAALVQALASLVKAHPADDLLYAHATATPRRVVNPDDPCGVPGVKGDFDVVAISVARGSVEIDEPIDRSGQRAAREDVVVGTTPRPVVLLLMGEAPVVWKIGRAPEARVAGVLAQGRHRQAVIGLPDTIPITTYSGADGHNACPHFRALDRGQGASGDRVQADARVRELFGRGIDQLITHKANQRFQVGVVEGPVAHAGSLDIRRIALPDDVMPGGQAGIDWLLRRKKLQVAKPDDFEAWRKGYEARTGRALDAREARHISGDLYLLTGETRVPYLAGADSRVFIVPPNVPLPTGDRGHSSFLVMDGFYCAGTLRFCRL